jgi:hypothetical protein
MVLIVLGVPFALYPGLAANFLVKDHLKNFALMVLIAASVRHVRDIERLVVALVFGSALYSAVTLRYFTVGPDGRLGNIY